MYQQIWKDIPTWEGIYQISNYGRIKSFQWKNERISNGTRTPYGYYTFQLSHNGRQEEWRLNRLVATVFKRPLLQSEDAHHKNKLRCCNCIFNIQIKSSSWHSAEHASQNWKEQQFRTNQINKRKGKIAWNKGRKCTEEEKQLMSQRNKLKWQNEQYREKQRKSHLGKKQSEETKRKRSESLKIAWAKRKKHEQKYHGLNK